MCLKLRHAKIQRFAARGTFLNWGGVMERGRNRKLAISQK